MKKKICLILIFIILFAFIIGSKCFADSYESPEERAQAVNLTYKSSYFTYNEEKIYFPSEIVNSNYNYVVLLFNIRNNCYELYNTEEPAYLSCYSNNYNYVVTFNNGLGYVYSYSSLNDVSTNNYTNIKEVNIGDNHINGSSENTVYYSNYDFYSCGGSGSSFSGVLSGTCIHQCTENLYEYGSLAQIYDNTALGGVLNEVILLLPIILPVIIIGFIGIRKGIAFIKNILRKS